MTAIASPEATAPPSTTSPARPKYIVFAPWPVRRGTGVNNAILGLTEAMANRYDPEIVVYGWKQPPANQHWMKMLAPSLEPRKLAGFAFHFVRSLLPLLRMARGAVALNGHYPGPELLPLLFLRRAGLAPKIILSVHGSDVPKPGQVSAKQLAAYAKLYAGADLVVACSGALARQVKEVSPQANVAAVWNGMTAPPATFSAERPLAEPYLISVAAFVWKKGHDVLLAAFTRVLAVRPDLKLILIGGAGPELQNVRRRIADLGLTSHVQILLDVPHEQVWNWVRHAETFVIASREEPFGLAILEAGLASTPVVATRVGGVPEFLRDGVDGLLCEPDDAAELSEAVLNTLQDPASARQRAAAFRNHAGAFTWDAAFEKYRELGQLP